MGREALELRQGARCLAQRGVALSGNVGDAGAFQEIENGCAGEGVGEAACGKHRVGSSAVVADAERRVWPDQYLARV